MAALLYSLIDSAQLAGIHPHVYLRRAVHAALDGTEIPLPHEIRCNGCNRPGVSLKSTDQGLRRVGTILTACASV